MHRIVRALRAALVGVALLLAARTSAAQADMSHMPGMQGMSMIDPLGVSMDRFGSGTTWLPEAATLPTRKLMAGRWNLMMHGFAFLQADAQGGDRGDSQLGSLNWGMFMASRDLAGGRFQARTMLSLDALTVTAKGYPLLLQSGESYQGQSLHDRQHPHDFFMELGAMYERAVTRSLAAFVYAAPSGEPALGPVAFMHRPSAMDNPTAPIGHHWQDATHISFGVLTAGVFGAAWKLEGSAFNGREPDEHRWNIEAPRLDSYSARLTVNPSKAWSFTTGAGHLAQPEALHPGESLNRVTASALYGAKLGAGGQVSTALVWGMNAPSTGDRTHSLLAEAEAVIDPVNTVLGRAEWVQKTAEDLDVAPAAGTAGPFGVGALSLGYVRELTRGGAGSIGLGAMGSVNVVPASLESRYGSRTPLGAFVFLRLKPSRG